MTTAATMMAAPRRDADLPRRAPCDGGLEAPRPAGVAGFTPGMLYGSDPNHIPLVSEGWWVGVVVGWWWGGAEEVVGVGDGA